MKRTYEFEQSQKFEISDYYFDDKQIYINGVAKLKGWSEYKGNISFPMESDIIDGDSSIESSYSITVYDEDTELKISLPEEELKKIDDYVKKFCESLF